MKAAEIRAKWKKPAFAATNEIFAEIAAQLAELNEKLEPGRLVDLVEKVQLEIAARDRRRHDVGGGPPS